MAEHLLMGGKLHVYKRDNSRYWQCSTYLGGKNRRTSTQQEGLAQAKDFAEDWYLELKGKHKRGEIRDGKTFADAAPQFVREFTLMTAGQRNAHYVKQQSTRLNKYLLPFFGNKLLSEITPTLVQDYRIDRHLKTTEKRGKPPARQTINQEIVTLRHVLNPRTSYSLRHTYICLRLMEGADIYQIAKNCRTSVEMIEKFYASHLKNSLDAAAINVRKPKKAAKKKKLADAE